MHFPAGVVANSANGTRPGTFGWLTWTGEPSEPALMKSLMPPGDSASYINPDNAADHLVSIGDWVPGRPGVANSAAVRAALDRLKTQDITVPVWDAAEDQGANSRYHVSNFARLSASVHYAIGGRRSGVRNRSGEDRGGKAP
jgi:hypothetical protein